MSNVFCEKIVLFYQALLRYKLSEAVAEILRFCCGKFHLQKHYVIPKRDFWGTCSCLFIYLKK